MKYIVYEGKIIEGYDAVSKARTDVERIFKRNGFRTLEMETKNYFTKKKCLKIRQLIGYYLNYFTWKKVIEKKLNKGDMLVIQYPLRNYMAKFDKIIQICKRKGIITATIVHDMNSIRYPEFHSKRLKMEDTVVLGTVDYVVCHNSRMKRVIEQYGGSSKIIVLNIFDYLCEVNDKQNSKDNLTVVYAGNLSPDKCNFLYQVDDSKINFGFNLYGVGVSKHISDKKQYKGKYSPDDLPNELEGMLGLVWDGNYDSSDENESYKNYTKYNNPHKLSCYVAAGLPVIVWTKSAVADFVREQNIGYIIDNIYEINNLDLSDYDSKWQNVLCLAEKVRRGYFTELALSQIER